MFPAKSFILIFTLHFPLTDPQKLTFNPVLIYDCLVISETRNNSKPKLIQKNRPEVPNLGYKYPQGYIYQSEDVLLR